MLNEGAIWTYYSCHSRNLQAFAAQVNHATSFEFLVSHHRRRSQRTLCDQERVLEEVSWDDYTAAAPVVAGAVGGGVGEEAFLAGVERIVAGASDRRKEDHWRPSIRVGAGTDRDEGVNGCAQRDRIYYRALFLD